MARFFSKEVKRLVWQRSIGCCEGFAGFGCGKPLATGDFIYDHIVPYYLSHDSTLSNCQLLCHACEARKTGQIDQPTIAKVRRVHDRHIGATITRHPLPCGRSSSRSRTMSGRVVTRMTQGEKLAATRDRLGGVFLQEGDAP